MMLRGKLVALGAAAWPQVGTPDLRRHRFRFDVATARRNSAHIFHLIALLLPGGSSSTAVTDGLDHEGGASRALYMTPGAAAIPCLLPSRVEVMWEGTMLACLLAVGDGI
jgi:hypothetical protein